MWQPVGEPVKIQYVVKNTPPPKVVSVAPPPFYSNFSPLQGKPLPRLQPKPVSILPQISSLPINSQIPIDLPMPSNIIRQLPNVPRILPKPQIQPKPRIIRIVPKNTIVHEQKEPTVQLVKLGFDASPKKITGGEQLEDQREDGPGIISEEDHESQEDIVDSGVVDLDADDDEYEPGKVFFFIIYKHDKPTNKRCPSLLTNILVIVTRMFATFLAPFSLCFI